MKSPHAILACDVFIDEIGKLLGEAGTTPGPTIWLEMGLHDHPDRLRVEIQKSLAALESDPATETILLAYGLCGNGLLGVSAGRCPLVLPRGHDCISVLLGGPKAHAAILKENPGTYFYSPAGSGVAAFPGPTAKPISANSTRRATRTIPKWWGISSRPILGPLPTTAAPPTSISPMTPRPRVIAKTVPATSAGSTAACPAIPTLLRDLLTGPWDDARFLVVPPGHQIAANADGSLRTTPIA